MGTRSRAAAVVRMAKRGYAIGEDGARTWVSADDVHSLLARGEILACEVIPWSSNYTFAARLAVDGHPDFLVVYKPRRGEIPLYDFPDGTLYKRERAAYLTSRAIGWDFIPPTIIRDGPHGIGSVQLYIDPEPRADFFRFKNDHRAELQRIALFDWIANNADRKAGHCLKARDGRIWGIDHGLTFHHQRKLRTVIWDYAGEPVDEHLLAEVEALLPRLQHGSDGLAELRDLLHQRELRALCDRIESLLEERTYPLPPPWRPVPWPPL